MMKLKAHMTNEVESLDGEAEGSDEAEGADETVTLMKGFGVGAEAPLWLMRR
jgi:hypothetical protein